MTVDYAGTAGFVVAAVVAAALLSVAPHLSPFANVAVAGVAGWAAAVAWDRSTLPNDDQTGGDRA